MFGIFKKSPIEKMENEHKELLTKAFNAQRNGDIRGYSMITAEAEKVREQLEVLKAEEKD